MNGFSKFSFRQCNGICVYSIVFNTKAFTKLNENKMIKQNTIIPEHFILSKLLQNDKVKLLLNQNYCLATWYQISSMQKNINSVDLEIKIDFTTRSIIR